METIITCTLFGVFVIISYTLGLKNGQKIAKNEPVNIEIKNPIEKIKEKHLSKEQEKELEKYNTIFENIDNYDGTAANQKEV